MTAENTNTAPAPRAKSSLLVPDARTKRRNAAETRFKLMGLGAIGLGILFLVILLSQIISSGAGAFLQTRITVPLTLSQEAIDKAEASMLKTGQYRKMLTSALEAEIAARGIETPVKGDKLLKQLVSSGAPGNLRKRLQEDPDLVGQSFDFTFASSSRVDGYLKGRVTRDSIAEDKNINADQLDLVDALRKEGILRKGFNWGFITGRDASDLRPEQSGMGQSVLGSIAMMLVVLAVCLPISVAASIYLEEFAPKNRFTDFIEVNISNLAAVPSIVFGILALAAFIQFGNGVLGIESFRASAPLVGGLALSLMTLPTIIIATRASLKAVPPSIRDAALGVGASKMQAVFHHVLPLALPGILTGTIIGLAAAMGETAPLLLIGMVAFVQTDIEGVQSFFVDPNVGMPAQIYIWATRADGAWYERAWGGIIVLLVVLIAMNTLAVILRRRFERRW